MSEAAVFAQNGDIARLRAALDDDPKLPHKPQLITGAARVANLDVLKLLVERGADPNAVWRGYRPLHALIQERPHGETGPSKARVRCLEWLLDHGADPEQLGAWPPARAILIAAFMGAGRVIEVLRSKGAKADAFVSSALGDLGAVRRALEKDPAFASARDGGSLTALHCCAASRMGKEDAAVSRSLLAVAELLLDSGADVQATARSWDHDVSAVYFAVGSGNVPLLELLLSRGGDATDALTPPPPHSDELAEVTLRHGADVKRAKADDRPLLNELIRWGQVRAALWLLSHGADPNLPDPRGWTAVHQAASRGNARMIRAVLGAGGELDRKDEEGRTPKDVARVKELLGIVRKLQQEATKVEKKKSKK
jgi:ankyrin repeat protein